MLYTCLDLFYLLGGFRLVTDLPLILWKGSRKILMPVCVQCWLIGLWRYVMRGDDIAKGDWDSFFITCLSIISHLLLPLYSLAYYFSYCQSTFLLKSYNVEVVNDVWIFKLLISIIGCWRVQTSTWYTIFDC